MHITVETLAIILSLVSFTVTLIAFFASLKFYRDGVDLQQESQYTMVLVQEKVESIERQVGEMFEKTLNAAIGSGKRQLEEDVSSLKNSLGSVVEWADDRIGTLQDEQREQLEEQVQTLNNRVDKVAQSAKRLADEAGASSHYSTESNGSLEPVVQRILASIDVPQSAREVQRLLDLELAERVMLGSVRRALRNLQYKGLVKAERSDAQIKYSMERHPD